MHHRHKAGGVYWEKIRFASSGESFFDCLYYRSQGFDAGEAFAVGFDDGPGRVAGAGQGEHIVEGGSIHVPFFPVAPVFLGDFPLLGSRVLSGGEAAQLLLLVDVQPELTSTAPKETICSSISLISRVGPLPFVRTAESLDALDQHAPVPVRSKTVRWPAFGRLAQNRQR